MITTAAKDIDSYIAGFPAEVQQVLQHLRALVHETVPEATEAIKYTMPTFVFHGNLVHFAAFTHHIGFYAVPTTLQEFKEDLAGYRVTNGSVQFPLGQPVPDALIIKLVQYRAQENLATANEMASV